MDTTDIHNPEPVHLSPDDLRDAEYGEVQEENGDTSTYVKVRSAVYKVVGMAAGAGALLVSPVAAADNTTINWTPIADLISGAAGVMPSINVLLLATVGTIMILMVLGFVTGIFGAILDAVKSFAKIW